MAVLEGRITPKRYLIAALAGLAVIASAASFVLRALNEKTSLRRLEALRIADEDAREMHQEAEDAAEEAYAAKYDSMVAAIEGGGEQRKPGVCLTFDDYTVDNWYRFFTRDDVKTYNPKVTFFICVPDKLTDKEIERLNELQSAGHEIGCHSLSHVLAGYCERKHGIEAYIKKDIKPAIEIMERQGFHPRAFAYPGFSRSPSTDKALLAYFSMLRGGLRGIPTGEGDCSS